MAVGYSVIRPFALIHRHSIGARRSIMLKPAPQSLRELPRAPPGSLPPPPGGFGLPPPPGFPGFRPGFPPMMPGMMRPPIMHGMRPAPNASVHPTGLTPSLLRLFVARPPVEYHPPPAKPKKTQPYTGIADYVKLFTDPEEDPPPPPAEPKETKAEKKTRRAAEKAKENDARIEEDIKSWNPKEDPKLADSDPYKTLFVGRLSYDVDEAALRREFERFGAVKSVTVVEDRDGKPRGYAFVEFDRESDMKHAYRSADGLRLEGRRILVDAERGRTVPDWRPRRFNGGLGGTRRGGKTENSLVAGRDQAYHNRAQEAGGGGGYAGHGYGGGPQQGHGYGGDRDDRRDSRRGSSRDSRRDDRDRGRDRYSSRYDRRDDRSRDRRDDRRDEDRGRDRYDDRDRRDRDRDRDRRDRDRDRSRGRDRYGYDDRDRGYKRDRSSSRGRRDDRDRDRKRHHGDDGAYPPPPPNGAAAADDDEDKEDGEL